MKSKSSFPLRVEKNGVPVIVYRHRHQTGYVAYVVSQGLMWLGRGLRREQAGESLEEALGVLRRTCEREETDHVHCLGCHFEDEAQALSDWQWNGTWPRILTMHCESEGDLACYGPAADEVVDWI